MSTRKKKLNIDRAAKGNRGGAGVGDLFKDTSGGLLGLYACNLGISTNLIAELSALIDGIIHAFQTGIRFLWIETDAQVLTEIIQNDMVPWTMAAR